MTLEREVYTSMTGMMSLQSERIAETYKDFSAEHTQEQIRRWQKYTRALLAGIHAPSLIKKHVQSRARNAASIVLPEVLTTERITYSYTHPNGEEETATFGLTGLKVELQTKREDESAFVFIGMKSRGENDEEDLKIGRELGVFLIESSKGQTHVTFAKTNRQVFTDTYVSTQYLSQTFLDALSLDINQALKTILHLPERKKQDKPYRRSRRHSSVHNE